RCSSTRHRATTDWLRVLPPLTSASPREPRVPTISRPNGSMSSSRANERAPLWVPSTSAPTNTRLPVRNEASRRLVAPVGYGRWRDRSGVDERAANEDPDAPDRTTGTTTVGRDLTWLGRCGRKASPSKRQLVVSGGDLCQLPVLTWPPGSGFPY